MRLVVEGLTKKYGKKTALNKADLSASNGIYGLLGPNGAGKTTMIRILAGILTPDSGKITFDGEDYLKNIEKFRYKMGYLPQEFGSFKRLTVLECMDAIAVLKGLKISSVRKEQIESLLKEVNLYEEKSKKVGALSGGMKRRLGIAQSMLANPSIIMVDEPTAGLDPEERIRFRGLIRRIAAERIILLSTHIMEDVRNNCDGLALIKNGLIEQFEGFSALEKKAEGKVWSLVANKDEYAALSKSLRILSTNTISEGLELRIYSEIQPSAEAVLVRPTVEEGYLSWVDARE